MKKIAIIDLGTNTFNLLISEHTPKGFIRLFENKQSVKLGEGGINQQIIQPTPFARGINALETYFQIIKKAEVAEVVLVATSAIRNAKNGKEFVAEIKNKFNWDVLIIDGNKEAELIYLGVTQAMDIGSKPCLIMDIGGGSTEFIIANNQQIFWKKSFEIGVTRLTEKFNHSEPITTDEQKNILDYLHNQLSTMINKVNELNINCLIGSSGSFDSFADVIYYRYKNKENLSNCTSLTFDKTQFNEVLQLFIQSNKEKRLTIKGLAKMRVDMIVVASLLIYYIQKNININTIKISTYALKEGVLYAKQANQGKNDEYFFN